MAVIEYSLEIMAASWGPLDVTDKVRELYRTSVTLTSNMFTFTPSNDIFGDPLRGYTKCFVMTWRVKLSSNPSPEGPDYIYSTPQTVRVTERDVVDLDYSKNLVPYDSQAILPNNLVIFSASYFNMDVTDIVSALNTTAPLSIFVSNQTFGQDPAYGTVKSFCISYAYVRENGFLDYSIKAAREGTCVVIPKGPASFLTVHAANFGGMDLTALVRSLVSFDQTFTTTQTTWPPGAPDPLPGQRKTLSILYQYGHGPLQLLVVLENTGVQVISPGQPGRRSYFNPTGAYAGRANILAVIWGAMVNHPGPVNSSIFESIADTGMVTCTNRVMGFDGLLGAVKTCQIFYQYGLSGPIQCTSGLEGNVAYLNPRNALASNPLSGRGLLHTTSCVNGFFLKSLSAAANYLTVTATGLSASTHNRNKAALFRFMHSSESQVQALQVSPHPGGPSLYLKIGAHNQLTFVGSRAEASQFDYELLTRTSSTAMILSLSTPHPSEPPLVLSVFLNASDVVLMPLASTDSPLCCYFGFDWNMVPPREAARAFPEPVLRPCTLSFIAIVKDWTIDLLSVLGNFHYFKTSGTKITQLLLEWWNGLSSAAATKVSLAVTILMELGSKGQVSVASCLESGITLLKVLWDEGAFWALITCFLNQLNWRDYGTMVANITPVVSEAIKPASEALKIDGLSLWFVGTVSDVAGGYNACAPNTSVAAQSALRGLKCALRKITFLHTFRKLDAHDQFLAANALLAPHYRRITNGDHLWPPILKENPPRSDASDGSILVLTPTNAQVRQAVEALTGPFEAELKTVSENLAISARPLLLCRTL